MVTYTLYNSIQLSNDTNTNGIICIYFILENKVKHGFQFRAVCTFSSDQKVV